MDYVRLGGTGLQVSRLCLGCMSFGDPDRGSHPWTLTEADSRPLLRQAVEAGITFFDTANVYSDGTSEEIVGRVLGELGDRDDFVIATKVHGRMHDAPNGGGLSRKAILREIDASLRRLGTDYVDLYQIHRWDPETPIEETMEALHDVVRAGKARYLGASSMAAWQFAKAQHVAERHGWTPFVAMQDHYNLLNREEEREMHPLCLDTGVGVIPWSPLARGLLTRPWATTTARSESDLVLDRLYTDSDATVAGAVGEIAAARDVPRAQVALAWLLTKPAVTAPIVGATRPGHLSDALAAVDLHLSTDEIARLEEPYQPKASSF